MVLPDGYEFVRVLGKGVQSTVKLAKDPNQKLVAIKTYFTRSYDIFLLEILGLKISGLYIDHVVTSSIYHIVMVYGEHTALTLAMNEDNKIYLTRCCRDIMQQLAMLQQHGLIHCDVKMLNIIYTKERVQGRNFHLIDFGISEIYNITGPMMTPKHDRYSAFHRSPDLTDHRRNPEFRDDLWAFGVTLLRMIYMMYPEISEAFPEIQKYLSTNKERYDHLHELITDIQPETYVQYGVEPGVNATLYIALQNRTSILEFWEEGTVKLPERFIGEEYPRLLDMDISSVELDFFYQFDRDWIKSKDQIFPLPSDETVVYTMMMSTDVCQKSGKPMKTVCRFVSDFIQQVGLYYPNHFQSAMLMLDCFRADTWYGRKHLQTEKYGCLKYEELEHYQKLMNDPKFHQLSIDEQLKTVDPSD